MLAGAGRDLRRMGHRHHLYLAGEARQPRADRVRHRAAEQDADLLPRLHDRDPDRCCWLRKVEPLARMLNPFEAWVSGVRRVDSPLRANTPVIEVDRTGRLKLNPIAAWTDEDVANFIEDNHLIINPLTQQGYPSIGCEPCTRRVEAGADPRSGRWAGSSKTECGIHV